MINKVLTVLKDRLNLPKIGLQDQAGEIAVIGNIAKHEDDTSNLDNKVVITLLSVEEESTMKNTPRYLKFNESENIMERESQPAYLNLYVMIAANKNMYDGALVNISKVIEIFQANNVLKYNAVSDEENDFIFRIELHSVPFDQLSYIWGLLGGKIMPSVLYKISVVKIVAKQEKTDITLIDEINTKSTVIKPKE
ncbi:MULTISPECIES: DUF4255 domain-containing protein [Chryseobacterium]|jgi:hypothetical protein|uniref:Pvc16 N-terminal domain-containing protein n=1 Tax=Chryseobacterium aquaticum subsp. greenlandense TaxID=345663 RepID=A0A117KB43_9FLAO|nr:MULTISPECIES: DUF4255 domain-containing protein [Chryseobacterium]KNB60021.1 hypothetical protein AC804_12305 [Chryseobacterium sp. Hurlbut01]KUJ55245.1 hypothetical protein AR686_13795 [Chryseobacterium aquaticum subsp. greenlandense]